MSTCSFILSQAQKGHTHPKVKMKGASLSEDNMYMEIRNL